jgi:toxin CcdB
VARRFDIVENPNRSGRALYPFLLVLQHDRVTSIQSVVVAPLVVAPREQASNRLHPIIELEGKRYAVLTEDLGSLPRNRLTRIVGSAEANHYQITAALDMLFTGI